MIWLIRSDHPFPAYLMNHLLETCALSILFIKIQWNYQLFTCCVNNALKQPRFCSDKFLYWIVDFYSFSQWVLLNTTAISPFRLSKEKTLNINVICLQILYYRMKFQKNYFVYTSITSQHMCFSVKTGASCIYTETIFLCKTVKSSEKFVRQDQHLHTFRLLK